MIITKNAMHAMPDSEVTLAYSKQEALNALYKHAADLRRSHTVQSSTRL